MITNMEEGFRDRLKDFKEKTPTLYEMCKTDNALKEVILKFRMIVIQQNMELEKGLLLMEKLAFENKLLNYGSK